VWPRNSRAHAERTAALNRRRREETKRAPEFSRRSTTEKQTAPVAIDEEKT
jgi:hypothetical protein